MTFHISGFAFLGATGKEQHLFVKRSCYPEPIGIVVVFLGRSGLIIAPLLDAYRRSSFLSLVQRCVEDAGITW